MRFVRFVLLLLLRCSLILLLILLLLLLLLLSRYCSIAMARCSCFCSADRECRAAYVMPRWLPRLSALPGSASQGAEINTCAHIRAAG